MSVIKHSHIQILQGDRAASSHARSFRVQSHMALALVGCVIAGCAGSFPLLTSARQDTHVWLQALDIPGRYEPKEVIRALEDSYAITTGAGVTIKEGRFSTQPRQDPAPIAVHRHTVHLEELGSLELHELNCPDHLATLRTTRATFAGQLGVQVLSSCIQTHATGYRITILGSASGDDRQMTAQADRLLHHIQERFTDSNTIPVPPPSTISGRGSDSEAPRRADSRENLIAGAPQLDLGDSTNQAVSAHPTTCFTVKLSSTVVYSLEGDTSLMELSKGETIVAIDNPAHATIVHVEVKPGVRGWVPREAVKRFTCPIG